MIEIIQVIVLVIVLVILLATVVGLFVWQYKRTKAMAKMSSENFKQLEEIAELVDALKKELKDVERRKINKPRSELVNFDLVYQEAENAED